MLAPSIAGTPLISETIRYLGNRFGAAGTATTQEPAC